MGEKRLKAEKILMLSVKIAIGASLAIYIAEYLRLENAASAGIITLLSVLTTKWGTLKLSLLRIVTFLATVAGCWLIFQYVQGDWIGFGIFLFFMVILCELTGLRNTLSVNAVIATHILTARDFSADFFVNELLLVLIGVALAFLLNLFHGNRSHKKVIIENMRYTEQQLQEIGVHRQLEIGFLFPSFIPHRQQQRPHFFQLPRSQAERFIEESGNPRDGEKFLPGEQQLFREEQHVDQFTIPEVAVSVYDSGRNEEHAALEQRIRPGLENVASRPLHDDDELVEIMEVHALCSGVIGIFRRRDGNAAFPVEMPVHFYLEVGWIPVFHECLKNPAFCLKNESFSWFLQYNIE